MGKYLYNKIKHNYNKSTISFKKNNYVLEEKTQVDYL